ncbi:MAG TPA: hypothetical protein VFV19_17370 [Candidatus Polarisedimenticolaceae bacterium]|nr:hypothetical protein [Candidatus Polarisedimenticolaceae bacterium]
MKPRCILRGVMLAMFVGTCARAQVLSQLKDLPDEWLFHSAVDGKGSAVYVVTTSNQLGTNPAYLPQIFRFDPVTGAGTQVTSFAAGVRTVSVTDDGQWIAFVSQGNLTGVNNDRSAELFVMHPDGTGLSQVTSDASFVGKGVTSARISGSGNRILFSADTDPLGTNPQRVEMIFVVNRDGTGLVQLGRAYRNAGQVVPDPMMAISDDGQRIAFVEPVSGVPWAITIEADGSNRQQRLAGVSFISLSGNGAKLAMNASVMNWDGTGVVTLPAAQLDGMTDDGSTVFYGYTDIHKINTDGTSDTQVLTPNASKYFLMTALSGDGSRLVTISFDVQGGGKGNLVTFNGAGGDERDLTSLSVYGGADQVTMLANATRMFFGCSGNLTGANPQNALQIFTIQANGTGLTQVTALSSWYDSYSVSDAGSLAFVTQDDLVGTNTCHTPSLYRMNPSGSPVQLTFDCTSGTRSFDPQFRFDGQWIVFESSSTEELLKIKPDATGLAAVTAEHSGIYHRARLSATTSPTWIVYQSSSNDDGLNPSLRSQIVRITLDGTSRQRLTSDSSYDALWPDVNGDGSKIVWESNADIVGENPGHVFQVFLRDTNTATTRQLTHEACDASMPRITRNGAWVYTVTCSGLIRVAVSGGAIERVQGPGSALAPTADWVDFGDSGVESFGFDSTGTKTAITGWDLIGLSPHSASLYVADQSAKPKFTVRKASPTLLSWDPDPQSIKYDVIRGNVANLGFNGTTVDLGTVTCLENDSGDTDTAGYEDGVDPAPGQAFFYVYRGTVGNPPVAGSYGLGSGNRERVAGSGGCNP